MDQDPTDSDVPADGAATLDLSGRCVGSSYILIRPIGQGATGVVWRAVDRASGEQVAVKLLHESLLRQPKLVTRFVQERTILLMLRHRNVVRVRDLFSVGESLALVMDLVAGGSLRDHLRQHHTVAAGEAARLASQVAAALAEAHELGIVHRDLKPDNILLQTQDGRLETRLTDFGIARVLNTPALTTPNAVVGTPHYMSPEAFHGAAASPAADVYALGVLLYELVTGRPPYEGDSVADLMRRHLEGNPERRAGIPDALWTVINSCLEQKPRLRPSAAELMAELADVARSTADAPALPPLSPPPPAGSDAFPSVSGRLDGAAASGAFPGVPGGRHSSEAAPAPPAAPARPNQPPGWRWSRPAPWAALICGAMVASAVATTAWHLGRAGGDPDGIRTAQPTSSVPAPPRRVPSHPSTPAGKPPKSAAADRRAAGNVRAERDEPVPASTAAGTKAPAVPEKAYGPMQCRDQVAFNFPYPPVYAQPCYNLGSKVQIRAQLAAQPGGEATVSVELRDTSTGRTVAAPHTCRSVALTDSVNRVACGPATVNPPHGHRYVVVMSWQYTRSGRSASGTANSNEFGW